MHNKIHSCKLATELSLAEERERRKLAAVLQDDVMQLLAVVKIKLSSMDSKKRCHNLKSGIKEVVDLIGQINDSIYSLSFQITPTILHGLGPAESAEWLADQMRHKYGLNVDIQDDGKAKPLSERAKTLMFCALRKLLLSVAEHPNPVDVKVNLSCEDATLAMTVVYLGQGLDAIDEETHIGFCFDSIRNNMNYLGGVWQIRTIPGIGVGITMNIPLDIKIPTQ